MKLAPGPVDDAPAPFLPARLRSYLTVLPDLFRDPLACLRKMARRYGDVVALSPGRVHLIVHPDGIRRVLQDNHLNYLKGPRYKVLSPLMGNGLLSSDGDFWLRQRRLIQPAFGRKHHAALVAVMVQETAAMLDRWRASGPGLSIDARSELVRLTLDILLKRIFGEDLAGEEEEIRHAVLAVETHIDLLRAVNPLRLPVWAPTPANLRFRRAVRTIDDFIFRIIDRRRSSGRERPDLVSLLVSARCEDTGEPMTDRELRDEVVTMIQAGHDTVCDALAWTWILLSKHPEAARRIEEEVAAVLAGRTPAFEDLSGLTYTSRVVDETMRLYPPAWVFARTPKEDDTILGYSIPANSLVVICPYVTHRSPEWWESPNEFDPDRFLPERSAGRPRFAYFPFSAGPRQCIGAGMAALEAQLIVAMTAQKYRLTLATGGSVEPEPRISLKPRGVVRMIVKPL